jgi:Cd2+/Zn2+-exporting ATPase
MNEEIKKIKYKHSNSCSCCNNNNIIKFNDKKFDNSLSFKIEGLDCASCALELEDKLNKLNFIKNIKIIFTTNTIYIEPKDNIDKEKLIQTLNKKINKIEPGVRIIYNTSEAISEAKNTNIIKNNILQIIGILFFIIINIFFSNITWLFFITYILIGYKVLYKALKNILNKNIFNENLLMSIATIGAMIIGEYFEANAVLIFYLIGEMLQQKATYNAKTSINALIDNKEEFVNKKTENGIIQIKAKEVKINDELLIKVGERFPVDCIIIKGNTTIDNKSLTGESKPVDVNENNEILAGGVNIENPVEVKAIREYTESAISKIINTMENAASSKSKIENFINKFSKIYTPVVCLLSLIVFFIYTLIFNNPYYGSYKALTFLVISCPCALVISIPLSIYLGIGTLSKIGILIKGGNYLEHLKDIKIVAFDKTGTLTTGEFTIVHNHPLSDNIIKYITHAEYYSNHPIAKSIIKSYKNVIIDENLIKNFKEHKGLGVEAVVDGDHIVIGNMGFVGKFGVLVPVEDMKDDLFIIKNKSYIGSIILKDTIKPGSSDVIMELKKSNIASVMLTGDSYRCAKDVSSILHIDKFYSSLLPWNKVEKLEELIKNKPTAFIGDGINDAPVLKRADVGIAIGDIGSDIAISAADMVLLNGNLSLIPRAIKISKNVNKIIKQNIIFTLFVKFSILLLTTFLNTPMLLGIFADVGVTLIAILNTLRIKKLEN